MLTKLKKDLQNLRNPEKIKVYSSFFKTGKGQYGEGDVFLGLNAEQSRTIAKKYIDIDFKSIKNLLSSKTHEERLVALLILVEKYKKYKNKKEIVDFYLKNTFGINNW